MKTDNMHKHEVLILALAMLFSGLLPAQGASHADSVPVAVDTMPGTTRVVAHTWSGGDGRDLYLQDAAGAAGEGWSLFAVEGDLTVTASTGDPFTLRLVSLSTDGEAGPCAAFTNTQSYAWQIVSCAGDVVSFTPSAVCVDASAFANPVGEGGFTVAQDGNAVVLKFGTNSLPDGPTEGTSIGVNFSVAGDGVLAPGDIAGAAPQGNWNDAPIPAADNTPGMISAGALIDDRGHVVPGASVSWRVGLSGGGPAGELQGGPPFSSADHRLMENWITTSSSGETNGIVVTVGGIPYASYDLRLYSDRRNDLNRQEAVFTVHEGMTLSGGVLATHRTADPLSTDFDGVFTESTHSGDAGNFAVIRGLTAADLVISVFGSTATPRGQFNAFQIHEVQSVTNTPCPLKAHWGLDDTSGQIVFDDGTNACHGFLGTATAADPQDPAIDQPGKIGKAYAFASSEQDLATLSGCIENFASDTLGALSLWFRTTSASRQPLFDFGESGTTDRLLVEMPAGTLRFLVRDNDRNTIDMTTTATYANGVWHHLLVSQAGAGDGSGLMLLVDGEPPTLGTEVRSGDWFAAINNSDFFALGYEIRSNARFAFDGLLDDVSIWDAPLSQAQAKAVFKLGDHAELAYGACGAARLFGVHAGENCSVIIRDLLWKPFSAVAGTPGELVQSGHHFMLWLTDTSGVRTVSQGMVLMVR